MYPHSKVDQDVALGGFAQSLARSSESECQEIFAELLRSKQLSHSVHCLNQLLHTHEHGDAARSGLCRLGFPNESRMFRDLDSDQLDVSALCEALQIVAVLRTALRPSKLSGAAYRRTASHFKRSSLPAGEGRRPLQSRCRDPERENEASMSRRLP